MSKTQNAAVVYRPAVAADAAAIAGFQIAMARETESLELNAATVDKGVRAVFETPSRGQYFVAEDAGRVIGSLLITYEWSDWRNGTIWWIQSVYVEPSHRGSGVFKGLYNHVRERVQNDPSLMGLRLYVEQNNTRAQEVYRKLGMRGDHYSCFEWMKSF
jgi:GNAT superfamily N-acetyltransferase